MAQLNDTQLAALRTAIANLRLGISSNLVFPRDDLLVTVTAGTMSEAQMDAFEASLDALESGDPIESLLLPRPTRTVPIGYKITRSIGGTLRDESLSAIVNARVTFIGSGDFAGSNYATVTDGNGNYTTNVANGWSGDVYPSDFGRVFTPTERSYTNVTSDITGQDYSAGSTPTYSIGGNIVDSLSVALPGVLVTFDGTGSSENDDTTDTTDANGDYSVTVTSGWTGTATPSLTSYTFAPINTSYSNVTSSVLGDDYTGTSQTLHAVSGTVLLTGSGTPVQGVVLNLVGDGGHVGTNYSGITNASGVYSINVIQTWTGDIFPSLSMNTFAPTSIDITTAVVAPVPDQDFTATSTVTRTISGTILNNSVPAVAVPSVQVRMVGEPGSIGDDYFPTTNASGVYSQAVTDGWDGIVTPVKAGFTFDPVNRSYSNLAADSGTQDYVATPVVTFSPTGNIYYVATNGSDSNDGMRSTPFLTLPHALGQLSDSVTTNDAVYLRTAVGNGVFSFPTHLNKKQGLTATGVNGLPIVLATDPQDLASNSQRAILQSDGGGTLFEWSDPSKSHWYVKDLIFRNGQTCFNWLSNTTIMQHFRFENCLFDGRWGVAALEYKFWGAEYVYVKDCVFSDCAGSEGCVDAKTSLDRDTPKTGSHHHIYDGCTFSNVQDPDGSNQTFGMIWQNNCYQMMAIDCTAFQCKEGGFASKAGGYNMFIRCLSYGRARGVNIGRKAAFYLRGPTTDWMMVCNQIFDRTEYLLMNCIGINPRAAGGDQGPLRIWPDSEAWIYNCTMVSLRDEINYGGNNPCSPLTISTGGGGPPSISGPWPDSGPCADSTINMDMLCKNSVLYHHGISFRPVRFLGSGVGTGSGYEGGKLRTYLASPASNGNCFYGFGDTNSPQKPINDFNTSDLTLGAWQATGRDTNSINVNPLFNDTLLTSSDPNSPFSGFIDSDDENLLDVTLQSGSPCKGQGQTYNTDTVAAPNDYPAKIKEFLEQWSGTGNKDAAFDGFEMMLPAERTALIQRLETEHLRDYNGVARPQPGQPGPSIGAYEAI